MKRFILGVILVSLLAFTPNALADSYGGSYGGGSGGSASIVDSSGDCTSGACGDGTSDGGSYYEFYHASGNFRLANNAGVAEFQGPAGSGFVAIKALSFTTVKTSGQAGDMAVYEANSTDTHAAGFRGPASITGDGAYRILFPNARASAAGQVLSVTNSGESGSGTAADPYIQTASWATPVLLSGDNSFTGANTIGDGGDDQRIVSRINSTNERWSGHTIYFAQCAASLAFGTPVYIQSTGKPAAADADAAATMPAIGVIVVASTDADTPCTVLTHGVVTDTDWNFTTVGATIYVSETAGGVELAVSNITDTNDVVQVLGIALHADTLFVNPSLTTVVLE